MLTYKEITEAIIGAAIDVHRELGPGLLESAYERCLCHEWSLRGIAYACQKNLPVSYKGLELDCGYRLDILVLDRVVIELKAADELASIHEAQMLTYLRLGNWKVGLIINFNSEVLRLGIKRLVNGLDE